MTSTWVPTLGRYQVRHRGRWLYLWPDRVAASRELTALLTADAGVPVAVRFVSSHNDYAVQWVGGPDVATMRGLTERHLDAGRARGLYLNRLAWHHT